MRVQETNQWNDKQAFITYGYIMAYKYFLRDCPDSPNREYVEDQGNELLAELRKQGYNVDFQGYLEKKGKDGIYREI
jgi:hypothetical protein